MSVLSHRYSSYYYNKGLERASLRDIHGAIVMLRRSLDMDKRNVEARNLLGLCYFEVGEVGEAFAQWVIVKNMAPGNQKANHYLNVARNNPVRLSHYRNSLRRYNNALKLMKDGGDDLALIQLRKSVSQNPNFVKAWQLLALLYMRNDDLSRARKALKRTLKTDIANPTSLMYLKATRIVKGGENPEVSFPQPSPIDNDAEAILDGKKKQQLLPEFNYKEPGPDYKGFISLLAGVLIGIMVVYFLVVPGVKKTNSQLLANNEARHGEETAQYLTEIDSLEKENSSLQSKLENEEHNSRDYKARVEELGNEKYYTNVIEAFTYFQSLSDEPTSLERYMLKQKLLTVSDKEKENEAAMKLYNQILEADPDIMEASISGSELLEEGRPFYEKDDYETALEYFTLAYSESPDNEEVLYLLARSYQLSGDESQALSYFREYMDKFEKGKYAETVQGFIDDIG